MPKTVQSTDSNLRRAVFQGLCSDPSVQTRFIRIGVQDGAVTLSGWVTSNVQKSAAMAAARQVGNVGRVVDEMSVALPAREPPGDRSTLRFASL